MFSKIELTIQPSKIGYLRFLLEGYDGMAVLSTKNRTAGIIIIRYVNSFYSQLIKILEPFQQRNLP